MLKGSTLLWAAACIAVGVVSFIAGSNRAAIESESRVQDSIAATTSSENSGTGEIALTSFVPEPAQAEPPIPKLTASGVYQIESFSERMYRFREYLEELTPETVEEYLAQLEELPPSRRKRMLMQDFFAKWGEMEGDVAFQYVNAMTGRDKMYLLSSAAKGWAKKDPVEAWNAMLLATNDGAMPMPPMQPVINMIADQNMGLAVELLVATEGDKYRHSRFRSIVETAANRGKFDEVLMAVNLIKDLESKADLMEELFQGWGEYQLEEPLLALDSLGDEELATRAMSGMMQGWAAVDGAGAFSYALDNQSDPMMQKAIPDIAKAWARTATAEELQDIASAITQMPNSSEMMDSVLYPLAHANPQVAVSWAMGVSDPRQRSTYVGRVVSVWGQNDLDGAEAFVANLSDESLRASAVSPLLYRHIKKDSEPARILGMVEGFNDQKQRQRAIATIVKGVTRETDRHAREVVEYLKAELPNIEGVSDKFREQSINVLNQRPPNG